METFVARQPIFDKVLNVFAYELLFRSAKEELASSAFDDQASYEVISNSFFTIGLKTITEGKRAFINFTRNLLLNEIVTILPPHLITVEILETITPDDEVVKACQHLKELGFQIALDDFKLSEPFLPFLQFADLIKIDVQNTSSQEIRNIVSRINLDKTTLLAEKVETNEEFERLLEQKYYTYYQGYFFCRPSTITGQDIPAYKFNYLQIINEIYKSEPCFDVIETYVKRDLSLSYKLLKCINSVAMGLRTEVTSIKHALVLMGLREFRKWLTLISIHGLGSDKPQELVTVSICRARFLEQLAAHMGMEDKQDDLFLLGLLSMLDAFVSRPMKEILEELPLKDEVKSALLLEDVPYMKVLSFVISYERGDWSLFQMLASQLNIERSIVPPLFVNSLQWAHKIVQA